MDTTIQVTTTPTPTTTTSPYSAPGTSRSSVFLLWCVQSFHLFSLSFLPDASRERLSMVQVTMFAEDQLPKESVAIRSNPKTIMQPSTQLEFNHQAIKVTNLPESTFMVPHLEIKTLA